MTPPMIMVAPNGARRSKADHPGLPVTVADTVETALACHQAGADALHLHIRDDEGQHSLDAGRYREALVELAYAIPQMPVQVTTEAAGRFDVAAQLHCLEALQPKWASISVREIARDDALVDRVYGTCAAQGTRIQHILYDLEDYERLSHWHSTGVVRPDQTEMLFVLGRYLTGRSSTPADLDPFLTLDLEDTSWMVCAFGSAEHDCLHYAAQRGADLRVGFENSLTAPNGSLWPDCATSVAQMVARMAQPNRQPQPIGG